MQTDDDEMNSIVDAMDRQMSTREIVLHSQKPNVASESKGVCTFVMFRGDAAHLTPIVIDHVGMTPTKREMWNGAMMPSCLDALCSKTDVTYPYKYDVRYDRLGKTVGGSCLACGGSIGGVRIKGCRPSHDMHVNCYALFRSVDERIDSLSCMGKSMYLCSDPPTPLKKRLDRDAGCSSEDSDYESVYSPYSSDNEIFERPRHPTTHDVNRSMTQSGRPCPNFREIDDSPEPKRLRKSNASTSETTQYVFVTMQSKEECFAAVSALRDRFVKGHREINKLESKDPAHFKRIKTRNDAWTKKLNDLLETGDVGPFSAYVPLNLVHKSSKSEYTCVMCESRLQNVAFVLGCNGHRLHLKCQVVFDAINTMVTKNDKPLNCLATIMYGKRCSGKSLWNKERWTGIKPPEEFIRVEDLSF